MTISNKNLKYQKGGGYGLADMVKNLMRKKKPIPTNIQIKEPVASSPPKQENIAQSTYTEVPQQEPKKILEDRFNKVDKLYDKDIEEPPKPVLCKDDGSLCIDQENDNVYKRKYVLITKKQKGGRKNKRVRKHKGIIQTGGNCGRLKKGYKYSGKKTKTGLPVIIMTKNKKIK